MNRQLMAWIFRDAGYCVLEAGTGEEALTLVRQRPELAVLDVNLPDVSGFEVCRRIKADPLTRGVSVVHLSAVFVGSGDRTQGLEQGADAYLIKPVEHRELLATVKAMLRIRAAEEAARRAAQEWRTTFDAISDAVCLIDAGGRVCRANRAMGELLGQDSALLVGRPFDEALREALGADDCPPLQWALEADEDSRRAEELRFGRRHFRMTADPLPADGGGVVILRDITQRKELEELVRQGQRLEAVGRLAGGVAHEFNNLLTAILGNVSMLAASVASPEDAALLETVERSAWRAADLTRQLLGFSRQALLWLRPVDPSALLDEVLGAVRAGLPASVTLREERPAELAAILADADFLKQVLQQLCRQAVEAMPAGGVVVVTAADVVFGVGGAEGSPDSHAGAFVRFSVADGGGGMPPEAVDKVFEPFYTMTGGPGGLSLAWVHGIAKQHRGWVECHSEVGRGTRFDLYVPCPDQPVAAQSAVPATVAPRPGPRRVLLADDNAVLLALAAQYLRQGGYDVVTADDGLQAVELYARDYEHIDLVILDQVMPHLTGQDALERMRRIHPGVRALIASGSGAARPVGE
ncbi:MAG: ATP-binding response regulator, partial [Gemmataceae bacterium]